MILMQNEKPQVTVIEGMDVNPFLLDDLVKLNNVSQGYDHQVHLTLQTLLSDGETVYKNI